jgi:hypothetical protein
MEESSFRFSANDVMKWHRPLGNQVAPGQSKENAGNPAKRASPRDPDE